MDRQYQQQQQYPSYNNNEGGGSASSSSSTTTPIAAGQKRTADQLTQDDNHDSFGDLGEGVEVKDEQETSQMGDASARTTAGNSQGKNKRTAAPPLKRGSACMLCRKRKLVSLSLNISFTLAKSVYPVGRSKKLMWGGPFIETEMRWIETQVWYLLEVESRVCLWR